MHDHIHHHHHHDHHHHDHDQSAASRGEPFDWAGFARRRRGLGIALLAALALWNAFFTVNETEFVLVTRLGRPVRTITKAGLGFKWPWETANRFDRRLRVYNPARSEFLTRDKKNVVVESYVLWRIADPETFLQTAGDAESAEMRLHDVVWAGLAAEMGRVDLEDLVAPDSDGSRPRELLDRLTAATGATTLERYGIEAVDVRVKRLNLPEQNKQSVYARMRAERERIARRYRSEGEEEALRIRAEADREREERLAAAYKEAERIKGEGDAEAARIYGEAYSHNPSLYKLTRTLETYRKSLDDRTTVVLSADSELLRLLTRGQ